MYAAFHFCFVSTDQRPLMVSCQSKMEEFWQIYVTDNVKKAKQKRTEISYMVVEEITYNLWQYFTMFRTNLREFNLLDITHIL